jgi:hypothetical protein
VWKIVFFKVSLSQSFISVALEHNVKTVLYFIFEALLTQIVVGLIVRERNVSEVGLADPREIITKLSDDNSVIPAYSKIEVIFCFTVSFYGLIVWHGRTFLHFNYI